MQFKNVLVVDENGVCTIERNGNALICPFKSTGYIPNRNQITGEVEIQTINQTCDSNCPMFDVRDISEETTSFRCKMTPNDGQLPRLIHIKEIVHQAEEEQ